MGSRFLFRVVLPSAFKIRTARATCTILPQYRSLTSWALQQYTSNLQRTQRLLSQSAPAAKLNVDYEFVQKNVGNSKVLIVDVREPNEVKESGQIPSSINIPLGNVTSVLSQMPEKEFEQTFSRPKPKEDTEIIFYCKSGKRAGMAQENAQKLGYKNIKNYLGSWTDWAEKTTS